MKAIVKTQAKPGIDIMDMDVPTVGDNDILLRIADRRVRI